MPKQPSRPVANKNNLDLTPPEEIRARRIRRFIVLGAVVVCALAATAYFVAPSIGRAIRGWQSRRVAREAFVLIEQRKWSKANAKARDALLLRPTEPESWRAIARLASRTGQWAPALEWWKKVDDAGRLTVEDRRDYIGAALAAADVTLAAKQVQVLMAQRAPSAIDLVWAGQLASRQSDPVLALDYAERVLADKRAKPYEIASAATLVLSATRRDSRQYAHAWKQIEDVALDAKNPASLDVLVLLANEQAEPPTPAIGGNTSLSLESTPTPSPTPATQGAASTEATAAQAAVSPEQSNLPPTLFAGSTSQPTPVTQSGDTVTLNLAATSSSTPAGWTMSLTEVADALENHPDARPVHKLLALEARARQDPVLTDQYIADAVERFRNGDDETVAALAAWLNKIGRPAKTMEVLTEARALQRRDLFPQYISALAALQKWSDIKDLLTGEHSVIDPVLQHTYLAVVQAHLGSAIGATNEWKRALETANTLEKLLTLATNAEQNSANDIADAAYAEAIKIAPTNRAAYAGRLRLALAAGKTAQAQTIAAEIAQTWPDDAAARNQAAYQRLLLGASVDAALPFKVKVVVIFSSLQIDEDSRWACANDRKVERLSSMPAASIASKKGSARPAWRLSDQATPLTSVRGRGPCRIFRLRTLCA